MSLLVCNRCNQHFLKTESTCPRCSRATKRSSTTNSLLLLLGLSVTACNDTKDTGDDAVDTAIEAEPEMAALYGVEEVIDNDGDGYNEDEDCNDDDPNINPDAEETPGDGVDSNCNDDDDI